MLSDEVRAAVFAANWGAKRKGDRLHFRCPRHDDKNPSAWMAGGAWGCFACGFEESIATLAEILGVEKKGSGGYTLVDYANEKRFPLAFLQKLRLSTAQYNGRDVVAIPYHDADGKQLRRRFRDRGGKWWEGRNQPIHLYGLDRLPDVRQGAAILIVEGESDCHAAWLHGFDAVGVPGATTWKSEWAKHLAGLDVYVWEEPDQGGAELVRRVAADFPKARVLPAQEVGLKDLADLHKEHPDDFEATLRGFMASAVPVGTPKPPVAFDVLLNDRVETLIRTKSQPIDAVPMPWPAWNHICCGAGGRRGLARGWHVVAGAKTGSGKSVLALNVAYSAMVSGERVCFVSLEMSQEETETRMLAIASGTQVASLEQGDYFDPAAIRNAGHHLAALYERTGGCFFTNRSPVHRLPDVLASMRYNHEVHGCRFFIVDYIQLAGNPMKPETIVAVSNSIRRLTVDLQVVTFGLSQFNRQMSMSKERPYKEGLMGGSPLENDAVQVLLIDHSRMLKVGPRCWHTYALVDKNRHGPGRDIPIEFDTTTLRMRERAGFDESD